MANIFISYRRGDSIATAGRIRDRLVQVFGRKQVFVDVDDIPHGQDFTKVLTSKVAQCKILLAIIGPHWAEARDSGGNRRIDDPNDFVGIEIGSALASDGISVIPVLVDGAQMPSAETLPAHLKSLALRNAIELRNTQFGSDADRLIRSLESTLGPRWKAPWNVAAMVLIGTAIAGALGWTIVTGNFLRPGADAVDQSAIGEARIAAAKATSLKGIAAWVYVGSRIGDEWRKIAADGVEPALTLDVQGLPERGRTYRVISGGLTLRDSAPSQRADKSRPVMSSAKGEIGPGSLVKVDDVANVDIEEGGARRWVWAHITVVEAK